MLESELEVLLGAKIAASRSLGVGFGLQGLVLTLEDGRKLAVKAARDRAAGDGAGFQIEAFMLAELARLSDFPIPNVVHAEPGLLVMSYIENDGGAITPAAERDAASYVAALHGIPGEAFGYARDTLIGPLPQPNRQMASWTAFFAEERLLAMGHAALDEGVLPAAEFSRLERLAGKLDRYLTEPAYPSLLHGDLWGGNVLVKEGRIAGFVDPAIYFGHPEVELAFTTMFGTFGAPFFSAYEDLRPLEPGFHELRREIYNLYPTLVHLRLFGAGYLNGITRVLNRLGF
ncbi:fructosamine kinase family protein [Methyloligella sp. 2.7D]|uniref:fructosamine kinase family protein n=1 Tax=unclassified Methyloligella TaxID=2625955 RepID=UPI00157D2516|nr:fructosamine kinase family protein [Methyloligella sp. GL2]QKP77883.1 fructosamine kinase family protein [Methyloligella sp. GL2]